MIEPQEPPALVFAGSLWRNRPFAIFWGGQTLSLLGSGMAFVALPLLVYTTTHSIQLMGAITALMGVGSFLAGLVSGPLADRFDRRGMMLCCDTLAVLLYGAIPLWWWLIG